MDRLVARRSIALALALVLTSPEWAYSQGLAVSTQAVAAAEVGRRFREQMEQLIRLSLLSSTRMRTSRKRRRRTTSRPHRKRTKAPGRSPGPPRLQQFGFTRRAADVGRFEADGELQLPGGSLDLRRRRTGRVSGATLDWTQLPGDTFNLRSNKKYTVVEARDIINEHLQARGYAILSRPRRTSMKVVHLDDLNTALVPRVAPEDLDSLPPHDLVKVSFRLDWLLAKDAVEEFKQVLSPKAKLLALKTTNRLEAIDSADQLEAACPLLDEEQGGEQPRSAGSGV